MMDLLTFQTFKSNVLLVNTEKTSKSDDGQWQLRSFIKCVKYFEKKPYQVR